MYSPTSPLDLLRFSVAFWKFSCYWQWGDLPIHFWKMFFHYFSINNFAKYIFSVDFKKMFTGPEEWKILIIKSYKFVVSNNAYVYMCSCKLTQLYLNWTSYIHTYCLGNMICFLNSFISSVQMCLVSCKTWQDLAVLPVLNVSKINSLLFPLNFDILDYLLYNHYFLYMFQSVSM